MSVAAFAGCADEALTPATSTTSSDLASLQRYVVLFSSETLPKDAAKKVTQAGGTVVRSIKQIGVVIATGPASFPANLGGDLAVLSVTGTHYFPIKPTRRSTEPAPSVASDDNMLPLQWDMRRIGAPALWNRNIARNPTNIAAVLDTGVMYDHPDLAANMLPGKTFAYCSNPFTTPGSDQTGYPIYQHTMQIEWTEQGGFFDCIPRHPADWFWTPDGGVFHGTHVSGTIAAARDNGGIVGVSPTTRLVPYKVFDYIEDNFGYQGLGAFDEAVWMAIIDATDAGIKTINMSLGGTLDRSIPEHDAAYLAYERVVKYAYSKGT